MGELTKKCNRCGEEKHFDAFHKSTKSKDGLHWTCKECSSKRHREHYLSHREAIKQRTREWRIAHREWFAAYREEYDRRPENIAANNNRGRKYRSNSPEKVAARTLVNMLVRDGHLKREPCHVCGDPITQAHHTDYSKPLDVQWLCFKHHRQAHGQLTDAA